MGEYMSCGNCGARYHLRQECIPQGYGKYPYKKSQTIAYCPQCLIPKLIKLVKKEDSKKIMDEQQFNYKFLVDMLKANGWVRLPLKSLNCPTVDYVKEDGASLYTCCITNGSPNVKIRLEDNSIKDIELDIYNGVIPNKEFAEQLFAALYID
jgi:hypothetical protein